MDSVKDKQSRELLLAAIDDVDHLVDKTVRRIEQTIAGKLREEVKAGDKDWQELKDLGMDAVTDILTVLNEETKAVIEAKFGCFDEYQIKAVEAKVLEIKRCG